MGNEQDTLAGRDPVDVLTLCCAEVDTFKVIKVSTEWNVVLTLVAGCLVVLCV